MTACFYVMPFSRRNIFLPFTRVEESFLKLFLCKDKLNVLTEKRGNEIELRKGQRKERRSVGDEGTEEIILH
jgi:hypothetical protein